MPIIVNGISLDDMRNSIKINNTAVDKVIVNNVEVWGRTYRPTVPKNFDASDSLYGEVLCTWTHSSDADWYQLIRDGIAVTPDDDVGISSPYYYPTVSTASYAIRAWNEFGYTDSPADSGTGVAPDTGNVTIDYNSVSGTNTETVTGSNGAFVFTPPDGVTSIDVCLCGGGGSGALGSLFSPSYGGGGYAGDISSQTITVEPLVAIPVVVGAGGNTQNFDDSNPKNGLSGGESSLSSVLSVGGAGGSMEVTQYNGIGATAPANCMGTFVDGDAYYPDNSGAKGGQACFANGGAAGLWLEDEDESAAGNGSRGSGGGAIFVITGEPVLTGAGGDGMIRVTWGT